MLWFKKTNEIDSIRFPGAKVRICSETILKTTNKTNNEVV